MGTSSLHGVLPDAQETSETIAIKKFKESEGACSVEAPQELALHTSRTAAQMMMWCARPRCGR